MSGEGRNLDGGQTVTSDGVIVLYATPATVASLSGVPGYDELYFTARRHPPGRGQRDDRRRSGARSPPSPASPDSRDLPQVRAAGDWPGKSGYQKFTKFFYVITVLALLSALVLISNTITTLVSEQTV